MHTHTYLCTAYGIERERWHIYIQRESIFYIYMERFIISNWLVQLWRLKSHNLSCASWRCKKGIGNSVWITFRSDGLRTRGPEGWRWCSNPSNLAERPNFVLPPFFCSIQAFHRLGDAHHMGEVTALKSLLTQMLILSRIAPYRYTQKSRLPKIWTAHYQFNWHIKLTTIPFYLPPFW